MLYRCKNHVRGSVGASTVMLGRFETNFHEVKVRVSAAKNSCGILFSCRLTRLAFQSVGVRLLGCSTVLLCANCEPGLVLTRILKHIHENEMPGRVRYLCVPG